MSCDWADEVSTIDAHRGIALGLPDGRAALVDLGLSLRGQANIFAGELFRPLEIAGGIAHLCEQAAAAPRGSWITEADPVECVGRRLVMLVGRQSVFLMAGEKGINPAGRPASRLELAVQLLEVLDLLLGLRLGDRDVLDCLGEALPQGRPVGPRPGRSKRDLLPRLAALSPGSRGPHRRRSGRSAGCSSSACRSLAASWSMSLRDSSRTAISELSCSPRPGHQAKHDLLLPGQLFEHAGALQVFLAGARRGRDGILHLAIERGQQGVGLLEVSRHGCPRRCAKSRSRSA